MFGYIKQQIAEQQKSNEDTRTQLAENKENDLIIECAQLFQELDNISVNGQEINQYRDIDAINISLEDDPEIDSFEVSMTDGRILDIPADILVHSESYEPMKSREDFVKIAQDNINQGFMSDDEYNTLIEEFVENSYDEYMTTIFQEGVFSAKKIDAMDPSIIWSSMVDFGPSDPSDLKSSPYVVRVAIAYEKLAFNKILLKQKDSISMIVENNKDVFKSFGTRYMGLLEKHGYKIPEGTNVWDIVTPKFIMAPVEPIDSFAVVVCAENKLAKVGDDKFIYISITMPISEAKKDSSNITDIIDLSKTPRFASKLIDKAGLLKESMNPTTNIPLTRSFQEGIDFGGDNGGDPADNAEPPAIDGGGDDNGDATSGDDSSNDNNDNSGDAVTTDTNDVSKEIAQNVADANEDKKNNEDVDGADDSAVAGDGLDTATTDLPEDDIEGTDTTTDDTTASMDDGDVDSKLADLDAMGNDAGESEELDSNIGDMNIEDMSPNQLTQAAAEKIKNMTMSQIQQFLQSDDGTVTTEAFVLTKKNINAELDAALRNCLGDLNDSSKSAESIMHDFKKDGKKLNRALSKASKMNEVYNEKEREVLIKLNKCLSDLMVSFRSNMSPGEVQVIKRLIKAFVSQAKGVGKIIDKHKNDTFQESVDMTDSFGLPIREI